MVTVTQAQNNYSALFALAGFPIGDNWYVEANSMTKSVANFYNVDHEIATGITAALSPQVKWDWKIGKGMVYPNLDSASALIHGYLNGHSQKRTYARVQGFDRNKRKAWQMLAENSVFPALKGPKVTAFNHNINDPWSNEPIVTIDIWMIRAGTFDLTMHKDDTGKFTSAKNVAIFAQGLTNTASYFGVHSHEMQSALWIFVRENWRKFT